MSPKKSSFFTPLPWGSRKKSYSLNGRAIKRGGGVERPGKGKKNFFGTFGTGKKEPSAIKLGGGGV